MEASRKKVPSCPREEAGSLSVLFFSWATKIFKKDYKKKLELNELWAPMTNHRSNFLGDQLEREWKNEEKKLNKKGGKPSLLLALLRSFKYEILGLALIALFQQMTDALIRPYLLGLMLSYFRVGSQVDKLTALYSAIGLVITALGTNLMFNHYGFKAFVFGMQVRASCISLVYRKCLRLSHRAIGEASPGQIVNLVSNDVSRFDQVAFLGHYLWCGPLMCILMAIFLYQEVGVAMIPGIVVVLIIAPLQSFTGKLTSKYRLQIAYKTDERIRLTDEILGGVGVIKMYAWEKPFLKFAEIARKLELNVIRKAAYVRGIYMTFNLFTTRLALFCTLLAYVFAENELTPDRVFVVSSYFNIMSMCMTSFFVRGFAEIAECLVSIRRLQGFMTMEEVVEEKIQMNNESSDKKNEEFSVRVVDCTASWDQSSSDPTLQNISLNIEKGQLVGVIGSVGAGKSSLLNILLNEMPIIAGSVHLNGILSYASQDPWVFGGTVKQNILFGLPYESKRYREVIRACSLERDLDLFSNGDQTIVGERGASLSGGQKARINLARAVYKKADIYLLDDPLSAVDTHVGKHLFQDCLRGFLRGKTIILATHQLQYTKKVDHVIGLENGKIAKQGSYDDIEKKGYHFIRTLSTSSENPIDTVEIDSKKTLSRMVSVRSLKSGSTVGDDIPMSISEETVNVEQPIESNSTYKGSVFMGYLRSGTNLFCVLGITILFLLTQASTSTCDYWLSYWTTQEEKMAANHKALTNSTNIPVTFDYYKIVYASLLFSIFVSALSRSLIFYKVCTLCSNGLHKKMIKSVMNTNLNFFNKNSSGSILNRFSKDLGTTDEILPKAILDCGQIFGQIFGAVVTSMIVNVWFIFPILIFTLLAVLLRSFYVKTSKNLKRLENMSRSPVFSHLNTSLQGLPTIRAHGAQDYLKTEFDLHQDSHTSCIYSFLGAQQLYAFTLDTVGVIYLSVIVLSFVIIDSNAYGADVGLAITQTLVVTMLLQWGMRQSSELVNIMTSVERILAFTLLPEESGGNSGTAPVDWPKGGSIEFKQMSLWYEKEEAPVINNLNLKINSGEKIGIVGRTGAGKSSLIAALFRLTEVQGDILIDGVSTADMPLQALRSRISIIPQNPVLFFGTIRRNLDPFNEHPDYILWRALDEVELREVFSQGLNTKVNEGGSNLSVGQRQLVCLARAIVRNNKIIVLDEATANIDPRTDSLIQTTIRKRFCKCTVLTIAHRLHTVMDSDRIIVMDAGLMVEFDSPHLLLQSGGGFLYNLVQETGKAMAAQLSQIAEKDYWRKRQESLDE